MGGFNITFVDVAVFESQTKVENIMFKFSYFYTFATSCNFLKVEINAVLLGYALR